MSSTNRKRSNPGRQSKGKGSKSDSKDKNPLQNRNVQYGILGILVVSLIIVVAVVFAGGGNPDPPTPGENPVVLIDTSMGNIYVELYPEEAPITVGNFLEYVETGFYDDLVFHRVIDGFMIQGGGFWENGTKKATRDPIILEVDNGLTHVDGAISMARLSSPTDSATSQFFICDGAQHFLDNDYAVFGVVIEGMDVVHAISEVQTTTKYSMQNWPVENVVINSITVYE